MRLPVGSSPGTFHVMSGSRLTLRMATVTNMCMRRRRLLTYLPIHTSPTAILTRSVPLGSRDPIYSTLVCLDIITSRWQCSLTPRLLAYAENSQFNHGPAAGSPFGLGGASQTSLGAAHQGSYTDASRSHHPAVPPTPHHYAGAPLMYNQSRGAYVQTQPYPAYSRETAAPSRGFSFHSMPAAPQPGASYFSPNLPPQFGNGMPPPPSGDPYRQSQGVTTAYASVRAYDQGPAAPGQQAVPPTPPAQAFASTGTSSEGVAALRHTAAAPPPQARRAAPASAYSQGVPAPVLNTAPAQPAPTGSVPGAAGAHGQASFHRAEAPQAPLQNATTSATGPMQSQPPTTSARRGPRKVRPAQPGTTAGKIPPPDGVVPIVIGSHMVSRAVASFRRHRLSVS